MNSINLTLGEHYSWVYKINANMYHSVAIEILESFAFSMIQLNTDLRIIAVRIEKFTDLKNHLLLILKLMQRPKLILGDINGQYTSWGKTKVDSREATITKNKYRDDNPSPAEWRMQYIYQRESRSSVDVSLVSSCIVNRLLWNISEDPLGSDHHQLHIPLRTTTRNITAASP